MDPGFAVHVEGQQNINKKKTKKKGKQMVDGKDSGVNVKS
jgi:hypothetical protein